MSTLTKELERDKIQSDTLVGDFSGAVRSLENPSLEVGDTWTFPTEYQVYQQKLGNYLVEYIWIELENGTVKKFYPSTFTKRRMIYKPAKVVGDMPVNTMKAAVTAGTAAEKFREYASVSEAMKALAGKKVKVTKVDTIQTKRFESNALQNTLIPTIDFV